MRPVVMWAMVFGAVCGSMSFAGWGLETGPNDFQITSTGSATDNTLFSSRQQMTYNSVDDEYLVIFLSGTDDPQVAPGEFELWSRRVSSTGVPLGAATVITNVGGLGSPGESPFNYQVAHNSTNNTYLLTYDAFDSNFGPTEQDVYARGLNSAGAPIGDPVPTHVLANARADRRAEVAYNSQDNVFLVVWYRQLDGLNREIYGRFVSGEDGSVLDRDFRIDTADGFKFDPSVAYDSVNNQYLVMWRKNDAESPQYQLLDADGVTLLPNDVNLGTGGYFSSGTRVAFSPDAEEYLAIYGHSDLAFGIANQSYEVFGRRIAADGSLLGSGKFRISHSDGVENDVRQGVNIDCGQNGDCKALAKPDVTYSSFDRAFVVSWSGTTLQSNTTQIETFVRVLAAGADPAPTSNQVQVSDVGGEDLGYFASFGTVAARDGAGYLVTWWGDDNRNGAQQSKAEIRGQRLSSDFVFDGDFGD